MSTRFKVKKQLERLKPEIQKWLKNTLTSKRCAHIERVVKTAKKYAKKLRLDPYKVELSALLHDISKETPGIKLLQIAKKKRLKIDSIDKINPHVLHARVGAELAKEKFKIRDGDILAGIRCHTLAEPNMSKIAMVVYLADATEPSRDKKTTRSIKRTLEQYGLEWAVLQAIDGKLVDVIKKGKRVHPLTVEARNWLISHIRKK